MERVGSAAVTTLGYPWLPRLLLLPELVHGFGFGGLCDSRPFLRRSSVWAKGGTGTGCIVSVHSFLGLFLAFVRPPLCRGIDQMALLSETVEHGTCLPGAHRHGRLPYIFVCWQPRSIKTSGVFLRLALTFLGKHGGEKKTSSYFLHMTLLYKFGVWVFFFFLNQTN